MNKSQFISSVVDFLEENDRLPYLNEDNVKIQDEDNSIRYLRANIRINNFFDGYNNFLSYLFEDGIMSLSKLEKMTGDTQARISNIINKRVKNPDIELRRSIHNILGIDFYEDTLTPYHTTCQSCIRDCKQHYYVGLHCPNRTER